MKKRITIGTLTLLSLMGMLGCKQQETVEALMTLDVKADYPEKEWVVQDFLDVDLAAYISARWMREHTR